MQQFSPKSGSAPAHARFVKANPVKPKSGQVLKIEGILKGQQRLPSYQQHHYHKVIRASYALSNISSTYF